MLFLALIQEVSMQSDANVATAVFAQYGDFLAAVSVFED